MESKNKARHKYNFSFKLKVIKFDKGKGKHTAAKFFNGPNSAKRPDKVKIVNKLYCILLTTLELLDYNFLEKNRHEVHYFSL